MSIRDKQQQEYTMVEGLESKYIAGRSLNSVVEFGALSDVGKVREKNEDHYVVIKRSRSQELILANLEMTDLNRSQEDAYLMMIADGVGGGTFGDIASDLVLRTVWEVTERMCSWVMRLKDYESQLEEIEERIITFTQRIQHVFQSLGKSVPEMKEMGSTLCVAYIMGPDAIIVNLGDSRAYVLREGILLQLTQDHTLAQDLINEGVDAKEVQHLHHVLTRCFSDKSPDSKPDVHYLRLQDNDKLMLCSDGLSDMVNSNAIEQELINATDPQLACCALVDRALEEGGKDNITVIVAKIGIEFD